MNFVEDGKGGLGILGATTKTCAGRDGMEKEFWVGWDMIGWQKIAVHGDQCIQVGRAGRGGCL